MMSRYLLCFTLSAFLGAAWAGAPPKVCQDKLAACIKANNCAKKPDTGACKECKAGYDKCVESDAVTRAAKKTTKR